MKIGICGICGRMGQEILSVMTGRDHVLSAAFDAPSASMYGKQAGALINRGDIPTVIGDISMEGITRSGGIIDFSSPSATMKLLDIAVEAKKPLVIGTTGLSDAERGKIESAASVIPVIFSPNMSIGVNLLFKLTEIASATLGTGFDVEIFEAHHRLKKDAPSGTAKKLLEIVKKYSGVLSSAREISGREGLTGERPDNEIGVFAMRGGDIVGEHTVFYVGKGERVELTHRATNRNCLASGAVIAMEWLNGRAPGLYNMFDVLGFK